MAEVSYLIPEPTEQIDSNRKGTLLYVENGRVYAIKENNDMSEWWAIGMVAPNQNGFWLPCIVSNSEKHALSLSIMYNEKTIGTVHEVIYSGKTYYASFAMQGAQTFAPANSIIPTTDGSKRYSDSDLTEVAIATLDAYIKTGGTIPGEKHPDRYLIPKPTETTVSGKQYNLTKLYSQSDRTYYAIKLNPESHPEPWWAIGMIYNIDGHAKPMIVSNVKAYHATSDYDLGRYGVGSEDDITEFTYNNRKFYYHCDVSAWPVSMTMGDTILPIDISSQLEPAVAAAKLLDLYIADGGTLPGEKSEYPTSWIKKQIDGNYKKSFTYAHAKTVYTDYANKVTLADKLSEIDTSLDGKANLSHTHTKSQITDFPTLGTASAKDIASSGNASTTQVVMGNDTRLSDARQASDVSAWAKASVKPSYSKSEVGLGNVDNTSDTNKPVSTAQQTAIDTAYANANKYTDKKVADLIGSAPETMDTLEEVAAAIQENKDIETALNAAIGTKANQSELDTHTDNSTIHITASERTKWNAAKTHADSTHARTDATKVEKSTTNGNIKINGTETTVYTHPSGTNPHGTTKSDVGLGNVGNFKAVSTVASQGLTDKEKSNARTNIGAGTSSFSGSYNDLTNKPTIPTVGNGTITIKQAGTSKGTFTMNQTENTTIELTEYDDTDIKESISAQSTEIMDKIEAILDPDNEVVEGQIVTTYDPGFVVGKTLSYTTGEVEDNAQYIAALNYTPITDGATYRMTTSASSTFRLIVYDSNKKIVKAWNEGTDGAWRDNGGEFTLPTGMDIKYIRCYSETTTIPTAFDIVNVSTNASIFKIVSGGATRFSKLAFKNQYALKPYSIDDDPNMHGLKILRDNDCNEEFSIVEITAPSKTPYESTLTLMNSGENTVQFVDLSSMRYDESTQGTIELVCQSRGANTPLPEFRINFNNGDGHGRVQKFVVRPDALPIKMTSRGLLVRKNNDYTNESTDDDWYEFNFKDVLNNIEAKADKSETTVNLLNPTLQTTTQNGVTCTNNGDGTYTLNGTASDWVSLYLIKIYFENGKKYKMVGCVGGSADTYYLAYDKSPWYICVNENGGIIEGTGEEVQITITCKPNSVLNNIVFKPMITTNLNATYDDFVPYTGDSGSLNGDVADLRENVDNLVELGEDITD